MYQSNISNCKVTLKDYESNKRDPFNDVTEISVPTRALWSLHQKCIPVFDQVIQKGEFACHDTELWYFA